jgi:hypothetical protein
VAVTDTEMALDLMARRTAAILDGLVLENPVLRDQFAELLSREQSAAIVEVHQRTLIARSLMSDADRGWPIAVKLIGHVTDLAWVTLITRLVDDGRCQLVHLGRFDIRETRGTITVDFNPAELLLSAGQATELPHSINPIQELAILLCHEAYHKHFDGFEIDKPESLNECAERALRSGLADLALALESYLPGGPRSHRSDQRQIDFDPSYLYARALAYATYYSYLFSLSRALRLRAVTVDLIGTFGATDRVSFVIANELFGLLSAGRLTPA